jgi:hypothetical protein
MFAPRSGLIPRSLLTGTATLYTASPVAVRRTALGRFGAPMFRRVRIPYAIRRAIR